jgi:hypothetical protein
MQSYVTRALAAILLSASVGATAVGTAYAASTNAAAAPASNGPASAFTVGDVLSRGGRQLTAAEMKAFLPGTQWYASIVGKPYVISILADGTWRGEAGRLPQFHGSWHVDERGRYCSVLKSRAGVAVSSEESCLHYFGAGDNYFVSATSDPGAEATPQRLLE